MSSGRCREASLAGTDGVVVHRRRRAATTLKAARYRACAPRPSAPKEVASHHFLDVAPTPPWKGEDFTKQSFAVPFSISISLALVKF